jgi:hypothetical protein
MTTEPSAHVTLHFALGLALGMAAFAFPVFRSLRARRPLTRSIGRWVLGAYAVGLLAVVPNILLSLGVSPLLCREWWMNLFVLHPALDRAKHGGMLTGELLLGSLLCGQYIVLLLSIVRAHWRRRRGGQDAGLAC